MSWEPPPGSEWIVRERETKTGGDGGGGEDRDDQDRSDCGDADRRIGGGGEDKS